MVRQVSFLSESAAVQLSPRAESAILSISNPGDQAPLQPGWDHICRIAFADASYNEQTIASYGRMWKLSSLGFPTKEHALAIRRFLDDLPPHIDTLIVHCGAGVSRSGAVAKYASERFGIPFPADYDRYNEALYRLLKEPTIFDDALARHCPEKAPGFLERIVRSAKAIWRV